MSLRALFVSPCTCVAVTRSRLAARETARGNGTAPEAWVTGTIAEPQLPCAFDVLESVCLSWLQGGSLGVPRLALSASHLYGNPNMLWSTSI